MDEAKHDAEAYDDAIEAHFVASEWYERAQLLAEIGIVIASIALLLSSRRIWAVSVVLAIGAAATIGFTYVRTRTRLRDAEARIAQAKATDDTQIAEGEDAPKAPPKSSK